MSRPMLFRAIAVAVFAILAFALTSGTGVAKKPTKPPPEPPPAPDHVIAYRLMGDGANRLMVMNDDGSNQTLVVDVGSAALTRPDWSPDGTKLVFGSDLDGQTGVYVVNLDGTNPVRIVSTERVAAPVWSPGPVPGVGGDAPRIAYRDKTGPDATWESDLFLVKPDGTDVIRLTDFPEDASDVTWSPDATRLAFAELNTRGRYCILDLSGSTPDYASDLFTVSGLAERPFALRWAKTAANVDRLALHIITGSFPHYGRDIYLLDLDSPTTGTGLTSQRGLEMFPDWSPDDSQIVFELQSWKNKSSPEIAVMDADGSNIVSIQAGGSQPTWRR